MSDRKTPRRWLIVVRRDQVDLYQNLREAFEGVEGVAVILDRRHGDRRGPATPRAGADRRRSDRRTAPAKTEQDLWKTAGFRLLHTAEDLKIYEAKD